MQQDAKNIEQKEVNPPYGFERIGENRYRSYFQLDPKHRPFWVDVVRIDGDGSFLVTDNKGTEAVTETLDTAFSRAIDMRKAEAIDQVIHDGEYRIPEIALLHIRSNPRGYTAEACLAGDGEDYREIRISVFDSTSDEAGRKCVADVLVGLNEAGEIRAIVTANSDGDSDHCIAVYPTRPQAEAIDPDWQ